MKDSEAPKVPWAVIGGPMNLVWAALPVVTFAALQAVTTVEKASLFAVAVGAAASVVRIAQRKSVLGALLGLTAVAVAAAVATSTGDARNYFSIGIWMALGGALLMGGSVLVRRPLVGYVWEALHLRRSAWRRDPVIVRRYSWAAALWITIYLLRFIVQLSLYNADEVGWLSAARIVMGWPLFALGVLATSWYLWRAERRRTVIDDLSDRA